LFPRVVDRDETQALTIEALLGHQRLHALTAQLEMDLAAGTNDRAVMRELGRLLEAHVRLEERQLFPLIEQVLGEQELAGVDLTRLGEHRSAGPVWRAASGELNATVLEWQAGEGPPAHVNEERDVLLVVLAGSLTVRTDERSETLACGEATIIAKGQRREITVGAAGARYLSAHRRRQPLQIQSGQRSLESERQG
jgi:mannose-6-phosphate isomerase-like protein (cupin superfamily)